jgi:predicted enzyme related to lactoylglutathione lyase
MGRITHFEIHATNPESLVTFYSELFGWTFQQWGGQPYWLITTGPDGEPGINGGMLPRQGSAAADGAPVNGFVCTAGVDNAQASLDKAVALGGSVALPVMPVPTVGWLCYAKDPDGNIFGMIQSDPTASADAFTASAETTDQA